LNKLKVNKSAGPDGIHPRVLKETADAICIPLANIFNESLNEGIVPQAWKDAHITALHKKGNKRYPANYRPISLTVKLWNQFHRLHDKLYVRKWTLC
jgi:hypothetical protein